MKTFSEILNELMEERQINAKELAKQLGLSDASIIYRWLKGSLSLLLPTAIKVSDFFNCSLDYLFGRTDDYKNFKNTEPIPFNLQFRKVLFEQKISQNKLIKANIVSRGNLDCWLNKKQVPHIESIIKIADYLNISMDYLVGRED